MHSKNTLDTVWRKDQREGRVGKRKSIRNRPGLR